MEVKIDFSKEKIETILKMCGYVQEEVVMYYYKHPHNYNYRVNPPSSDLIPININVAYLADEDVGWRYEEKPLLSKYEKYKYDNVVNDVINDILYKRIFSDTMLK